MKNILLLITLCINVLGYSQIQIGQDIDGETTSSNLVGGSVSMSANGTIVAIGTPFNNGNGENSGQVRVYQNINSVWTQIGSDIDGEALGDFSGDCVSISADGSIVAIGARLNDGNGDNSGHVRVYKNVNNIWTQIGADIDGEAAGDHSGYSVSLSSDGTIVAIGARRNAAIGQESGHVRVYKNMNNVWTQIGADIDGEAAFNSFGQSVSLSSDGTIVAIGANTNNINGNNSGYVSIFKNTNNIWNKIGVNINGEATGDESGWSLSLSSDGSIVAIGAIGNDENGFNAGHARIYKNTNNVWTQIGTDIDGEAAGDWFGWSVSLNSDGSIAAIGSRFNNGNGAESGHVRIFKNMNNVWTQIGTDIDGENAGDWFGWSVSLNNNGSTLAVFAPLSNSVNGSANSGHTRVFDLSSILSTESFELDYFSIYPNPAQDVINIGLKQGIALEKVNIYNTLGQFISTTQDLKINTSNFTRGVYFIEIETNQGKSAKKLIIE